jgi:hypothetical protein
MIFPACLMLREFFYGALRSLTGMPSGPSNVPRQIIAAFLLSPRAIHVQFPMRVGRPIDDSSDTKGHGTAGMSYYDVTRSS